MKIVAEGAETSEQVRMLLDMNCDFIQGNYFSKPLEEKEFLKAVKGFSICEIKA